MDKCKDWLKVIQSNSNTEAEMLGSIPEPTNSLQADSICCFRAAIRWTYEDHKITGVTGLSWEGMRSPSLDFLLKQAKSLGPEKKKRNYAVKIVPAFTLYQVVEQFSNIQYKLQYKRNFYN
jgi:hypothetical protein